MKKNIRPNSTVLYLMSYSDNLNATPSAYGLVLAIHHAIRAFIFNGTIAYIHAS